MLATVWDSALWTLLWQDTARVRESSLVCVSVCKIQV